MQCLCPYILSFSPNSLNVHYLFHLELSRLHLNSVETIIIINHPHHIVIVILSCFEVVQIYVRLFPVHDWIIMDMYET